MSSLRDHLKASPFGWHNGRLLRTVSSTDAECIAWLQKLESLVDSLPDQSLDELKLGWLGGTAHRAYHRGSCGRADCEQCVPEPGSDGPLSITCPTCCAAPGVGCSALIGKLTMGDYDAEFHETRRPR